VAATFDTFTGSAKAVFIGAQSSAQTLGHVAITPEHLLMGLLSRNPSDAGNLLDDLSLNRQTTWNDLRALLPYSGRVVEGHVPLAQETKAVIARAMNAARDVGRGEVSTAILLLAILQDTALPAARLLAEQGVSADGVTTALGDSQSQEQLISPAGAKRRWPRPGKSS
jgi:ATP-dependent Clp protease ATP-binding subunit ClpB